MNATVLYCRMRELVTSEILTTEVCVTCRLVG